MDEKKLQEMVDEITKGKEFDRFQMSEIREGFKNGLSMKQVLLYAKPEFEADIYNQQM